MRCAPVLSGLLLWGCLAQPGLSQEAAPQTLPPVEQGGMAPELALKDINGTLHRLSDYRGKVVILNFWATWCPPCRLEMPSMERARKAVEGEDIVILAVDVGESEDTVFEFTASYPVEFTLLLDTDGKVVESYPVTGLPTTYIVGPDGRLVYRAVGSREWDDPALLAELRRLLPGPARP